MCNLPKRDILKEKYGSEESLNRAQKVLHCDEQTEEAFLGAQAILMLHGKI